MRGTPPPEAVAATPAPEEGEGLVVSRRRKEEEEVVVVSFRLLSAFFFSGARRCIGDAKTLERAHPSHISFQRGKRDDHKSLLKDIEVLLDRTHVGTKLPGKFVQ